VGSTNDWHGCYDGGWQGLIVPEAFAHPAKFSRALVARIYDHCRAEGWLAPGDVVLDPFGGVALGALDAMRLGLSWVGCELEPKFVALGGENIALWNRRFGHVPGWGTAKLLRGDSRELSKVVEGAGLVCSSPPYSHPAKGISAEEMDKKMRICNAGRIERGEIQGGIGHSGRMGKSICNPDGYSDDPANLGNLPATSRGLAAAISSPPFGDQNACNDPHYTTGRKTSGGPLHGDYGNSPGQLGAMRAGQPPSAVVSSPPYEQGLGHKGVDKHPERACHNSKGRDMNRYGAYGDDSPGNLGNLPPGDPAAVISSPPYERSMDTTEQADKRAARTGGFVQGMKDTKYGQNPNTFLSKDPSGLNNQQRHEIAARNPQVGALDAADFWSASRVILEQVFAVLKPGGHAVWVCKDFVRAKQRVPFSDQWQALCEAVGFRCVCQHRALLVSGEGTQTDAFGQDKKLRRERKSFFRRLAEAKGSPRIDAEDVRCFVKPIEKKTEAGRKARKGE
jgi:hypothetical protein